MRIHWQFGIIGASIIACASTFCLSPWPALSQTSEPASAIESVPPEQESAGPVAPSWQELHDQHRAVLEAIGSIGQQSETVFARYANVLDSKLEVFQDIFASHHRQELETQRQTNRFMLAFALVLAALCMAGILFMGLLPVRSMNRLAATLRSGASNPAAQSGLWTAVNETIPPAAGANLTEPDSAQLQVALQNLEKRLLAIEDAAHALPVEVQASGAREVSKRATLRTSQTVTAKSGGASRVALTVGAGESLFFLPQDQGVTRFHSIQKFWPRLRKLLVPIRTRQE